MTKLLFITGTDTDIGKTFITVGLLRVLAKQGKKACAIKPIASGSNLTSHGCRNEDALLLQQAATYKLAYEEVNPWAFIPPIAPYIAAQQQHETLSVQKLIAVCRPIFEKPVDNILIEGVGGWLQLLNCKETLADFVKALNIPVLMVVGMRLGCLNHALLTYQSIQSMQVTCLGWIANCLDPKMLVLEENIAILKETLPVPCLGVVPYGHSPEDTLFTFKF